MKNTAKHTAPNLLVCLEEPLTQTPLATPPDQVESFFLTGRKIQAQTYDWIFLEESKDRDRKNQIILSGQSIMSYMMSCNSFVRTQKGFHAIPRLYARA